MTTLKRNVRPVLNWLGWDLHRVKRQKSPFDRSGLEWSIDPVRAAGVQAKTVLDVGAAGGTPPLYELFPGAYFIMVEPIREFEPDLNRVLERHKGEIIWVAAGETAGMVTINVDVETPMQSSLMRRISAGKTDTRQVNVDRLDTLLDGRQLEKPVVLKLDVEGFEEAVLKGAERTLKEIDAVIIEISSDERYVGLQDNVRKVDKLLREAGLEQRAFLHASLNWRVQTVSKVDALYTR